MIDRKHGDTLFPITYLFVIVQIEDSPPLAGIGEHEIDFSVVQLLETSVAFREWLTTQVTSVGLSNYLGAVAHAEYAGEGESDIEYGFVTPSGDRHVVLIENKIDAALQPDQYQRYHNRGQFRVNRQAWDTYTVCLVAPENYVSESDEEAVDSVVLSEDLLEQLGELVHDSSAFFQTIFEEAIRKPSRTSDVSDVINSIAERFDENTEIKTLSERSATRTQLTLESTHPDHPDSILYNIYIATPSEDGRTNVRLQIGRDAFEAERETLKQEISAHADLLPEYEWNFDYKEHTGLKKVWHRDAIQSSSPGGYKDDIANELIRLTNTIHPRLVDDRQP